MEIMRFAPQLCCANKLLSETVRKKVTKADIIKRIMKEQKASFGELLETNREKTRRLKLEKQLAIPPEKVESTGDSELSWMLKVSNSRLQRIKLDGKNKLSIDSETSEKNRVQKRIIRKISAPKVGKSNTSSSESPEIMGKSLGESQIIKKITEPNALISKTANPSESSAVVEKNSNKTEIEQQGEGVNSVILLPRENIIENINEALLCRDEREKYVLGQSSEILSISPMGNKEYFKFPSVTHILNATMSDNARKILELWMAKMIRQLGQEGFDEYKRGLLLNGKLLHSAIDSTLRKLPIEVPDDLKPCFNSVKIVLDEVENVRVIESQVVHYNLGYRGVVDCVASYRGNLCLIDWKKSDKTKHLLSSTYDAPLQIASYIGALNADKNYPFQIKSGLLVVAYTIGDPPTIFTLDQTKLEYYWKKWLERLKKYYTMLNT